MAYALNPDGEIAYCKQSTVNGQYKFFTLSTSPRYHYRDVNKLYPIYDIVEISEAFFVNLIDNQMVREVSFASSDYRESFAEDYPATWEIIVSYNPSLAPALETQIEYVPGQEAAPIGVSLIHEIHLKYWDFAGTGKEILEDNLGAITTAIVNILPSGYIFQQAYVTEDKLILQIYEEGTISLPIILIASAVIAVVTGLIFYWVYHYKEDVLQKEYDLKDQILNNDDLTPEEKAELMGLADLNRSESSGSSEIIKGATNIALIVGGALVLSSFAKKR